MFLYKLLPVSIILLSIIGIGHYFYSSRATNSQQIAPANPSRCRPTVGPVYLFPSTSLQQFSRLSNLHLFPFHVQPSLPKNEVEVALKAKLYALAPSTYWLNILNGGEFHPRRDGFVRNKKQSAISHCCGGSSMISWQDWRTDISATQSPSTR
uniref:Uncharacterized protein n=1 Tax=Ditylenchus dipsaci TaxID=166011 RepID=A0A915ET16_9BILA